MSAALLAVLGVVLVALIGAVGPWVTTTIQGKQRRAERQQEWDRSDRKADELKAATVEAAEAVAVKVSAVESKLDESTSRTDTKLDELHVLANSAYSAQLDLLLASLEGQVVLHRRVMALTEDAGQSIPEGDRLALSAMEALVEAKRAEIASRDSFQQEHGTPAAR